MGAGAVNSAREPSLVCGTLADRTERGLQSTCKFGFLFSWTSTIAIRRYTPVGMLEGKRHSSKAKVSSFCFYLLYTLTLHIFSSVAQTLKPQNQPRPVYPVRAPPLDFCRIHFLYHSHDNYYTLLLRCYLFCEVLEVEAWVSHIVGKCSTTEWLPWPLSLLWASHVPAHV